MSDHSVAPSEFTRPACVCHTLVLVGAAIALVVGLAGCGSSTKLKTAAPSGGGPTPVAAAAAGYDSLTVNDFTFAPTSMSAAVGAAIIITNNGAAAHTVTDSSGTFDTGYIAPGTSKSIILTTGGSYFYYDDIHPLMTGIIDVSG
jgi:plastocyanin